MDAFTLHTPVGLPPAAGYSHVAEIAPGTRLILISGQLPLTADGRLVEGGVAKQAAQVFANLETALSASGAFWRDVVRLGIFLLDLDGITAVRAERDAAIGDGRPPASTLVRVAGLAVPGALLEIEATAAVTSRR
jgi:enamine deaminase RidA (YjgF/YER057c/UK114 family)